MIEELTIALVASLGSLLGVVVGAVFSYLISRKQFQATVIAGSRQAWIDSLRATLAEFMSLVAEQASVTDVGVTEKEHIESAKRLVFLFNQAKLMLNPDEPDHARLIRIMDDMLGATRQKDKQAVITLAKPYKEVSAVAQRVLKAEWTQIKDAL